MPKLKPVDYKTLIKIFEADGFTQARSKGSHRSLVKEGVARPIVIPSYDEVGLDIIKSCMKTAGMSRETYFRLLKKMK